MGRLTVLCLVFLSVFLLPLQAGALPIQGALWSTDALTYAQHPNIAPPFEKSPDATFILTGDINFDSRRAAQPKNITFNEFLNNPTWTNPAESKFDPDKKMYENNGKGNGDEGVLFTFSWAVDLTDNPLPINILHDDGIYFFFPISPLFFSYSAPDQVDEVKIAKFDLAAPAGPGIYTVQLNFGAINDPDPDVAIFATPEPGSMILLALGILGVGGVRRRN